MLKQYVNKFMKNEIFLKGLSALVFKFLGMLAGFLFMFIGTKRYGAENWGVFALCLGLLNISSILSRLGIDLALVKMIAVNAKSNINSRAMYITCLKLVFFTSIFFSIFLFIYSEFLAISIFNNYKLSYPLKILSFLVLPFSLTVVNAQTLRGFKSISSSVFLQHASRFLFSLLLLVIIDYFDIFNNDYTLIFSYSIAVFITMFLSFKIIRKYDIHSVIVNKVDANAILKISIPMMFASSVVMLINWIDTIMLGVFMNEDKVGIYNVVIKIAMLSNIILFSVNAIMAPKISASYNSLNMSVYRSLVKKSIIYIFVLTLPIILLIGLFSSNILQFFGDGFVFAKSTLLILLFGQMIASLSGSGGIILLMTGRQDILKNIMLFALLINVLLNIVLIPIYGIMGAAISSFTSIIFWNIFCLLYVLKNDKIKFFN